MWIGFFAMILLIGYAYVGYPIVAYVLSKLKPVGKEHNKNFYAENNVDLPNVTAVIVIHNEGQRIIDKITNLKELSYDQDKLSILIVNDHCTDNSVELLNKHYPDVTVITNNGRGKAAGINTAYQNINDELVLMLDARQMLESQALISLVNNFVDSQVGAISGELMIESMDGNRFANAMGGYWKYEKFVRKCEAKIGKVPGVTGAIYMIRRKAFRAIDENTLLDDVLIPMNAAKLGYKIGFETNAIAWDVPSDDPKREKRRKVRTLAGNYQLLFRHLWWCIPFMHPIAFQFISHKILRILVPIFAIMASIFFVLAFAAPWLPLLVISIIITGCILLLNFPFLQRNKLLSLLEAIIRLNWYALLALLHYAFGSKKGAWK